MQWNTQQLDQQCNGILSNWISSAMEYSGTGSAVQWNTQELDQQCGEVPSQESDSALYLVLPIKPAVQLACHWTNYHVGDTSYHGYPADNQFTPGYPVLIYNVYITAILFTDMNFINFCHLSWSPFRYIPRDNIHEINTRKCPIQTQCGYAIYSAFIIVYAQYSTDGVNMGE